MNQIRFSFDKETIKKIIVGFFISAVPASIIWTIGYIMNFPFSNADIAAFIAWVGPVLTYAVYKIQEGKLTWAKLGWSVLLSTITAGIILLRSTTWCVSGEVCAQVNALIALFAPTAINALKEWIRGECGQK